jgi:branched-chain amino acid transport system substrate-binding protein
MLARLLGATRLFVLNDREPYGLAIASATTAAAKKLGLKVVRFAPYDPTASSYSTLAAKIRASGAQAVFLGGLIGSNGGRLIADIRAGAPGVTLIAPAGFTPVSSVVKSAGGAAEGLYVSSAGLPVAKLPPVGQTFAKSLARASGTPTDPAAVYAAQAADVLLQAIADSNGTRAGVAAHLLGVALKHALVGTLAFDSAGDPLEAPVTIYRVVHGAATPVTVLVPSPSLVAAG